MFFLLLGHWLVSGLLALESLDVDGIQHIEPIYVSIWLAYMQDEQLLRMSCHNEPN